MLCPFMFLLQPVRWRFRCIQPLSSRQRRKRNPLEPSLATSLSLWLLFMASNPDLSPGSVVLCISGISPEELSSGTIVLVFLPGMDEVSSYRRTLLIQPRVICAPDDSLAVASHLTTRFCFRNSCCLDLANRKLLSPSSSSWAMTALPKGKICSEELLSCVDKLLNQPVVAKVASFWRNLVLSPLNLFTHEEPSSTAARSSDLSNRCLLSTSSHISKLNWNERYNTSEEPFSMVTKVGSHSDSVFKAQLFLTKKIKRLRGYCDSLPRLSRSVTLLQSILCWDKGHTQVVIEQSLCSCFSKPIRNQNGSVGLDLIIPIEDGWQTSLTVMTNNPLSAFKNFWCPVFQTTKTRFKICPLESVCIKDSSQTSSCRGQERSFSHSSSITERDLPPSYISQRGDISPGSIPRSYSSAIYCLFSCVAACTEPEEATEIVITRSEDMSQSSKAKFAVFQLFDSFEEAQSTHLHVFLDLLDSQLIYSKIYHVLSFMSFKSCCTIKKLYLCGMKP